MPTAFEMMIHNGTYIDFSMPEAAQFGITDIAQGLSKMCRYSGQGAKFYSVAEHSVRVGRMIYDWTGDKELAAWGEIHDGAEAFLPDMPKPAKALLPDYRRLEARVWSAVCSNLYLPSEEIPLIVHVADALMLAYEGGVMFPEATDRWWLKYGNPTEPEYVPECWTPEVAYEIFIRDWDFYTS